MEVHWTVNLEELIRYTVDFKEDQVLSTSDITCTHMYVYVLTRKGGVERRAEDRRMRRRRERREKGREREGREKKGGWRGRGRNGEGGRKGGKGAGGLQKWS